MRTKPIPKSDALSEACDRAADRAGEAFRQEHLKLKRDQQQRGNVVVKQQVTATKMRKTV